MINDYEKYFSIDNAKFSIVESFPPDHTFLPSEAYKKLQMIKTTHTHTAFEIFFIGDSPLTFVSNEDSKELKNQILIVPPFLPHYTVNSEKSFVFFFTVKQAEHSLFSFLNHAASKGKTIVLSDSDTIKKLVRLLIDAQSHLQESDPYKLPAIYSLLFLEIRDGLIEKKEKPHSLRLKEQCDYVETINDVLLTQFMNNITLADIANALNLSLKQTARVIKKGFNTTFSALLLERRLAVATLYLSQTKLKISEIIETTGFQTENYFFSKFKEKFGVTPLAYRARFQYK